MPPFAAGSIQGKDSLAKDQMIMQAELLFVYNADSGLFNTLTDIAHKLLSPSTYSCQLCALTHTALGMREEWRRFLESLEADLHFLHRDEWLKQEGDSGEELPAIFLQTENGPVPFLSATAIRSYRTLGELQQAIRSRLQAQAGASG